MGISIYGPEDFHDEYRRNRGGRPSFAQTMRGIRMLQRHGVEWNAMAVVNDYNADYPDEFYTFFRDIGCRFRYAPTVTLMLQMSHSLGFRAGGTHGRL